MIFNLFKFPILLLIFIVSGKASAAPRCADLFATFKMTPEIQKSMDDAINALAKLRIDLDLKQAQGQSSVEIGVLSHDYTKKENGLISYLEQNKIMTESELIAQVKSKIRDLQSSKSENTPKETEDSRRLKESIAKIQNAGIDGRKAVFHRVQPGKFLMSDHTRPNNEMTEVTLTKPFEMMATLTTQVIWRQIVELAQKRFGERSPDMQMKINPSERKGDLLPVEWVSYHHVTRWLSALNRLSKVGTPELESIIVGHKKGDVYRLPTEAEWEFVARGRGEFNEPTYYLKDATPLGDFDRDSRNPGFGTQPVAQRLPLKIEYLDFYDMLGNVQVWTADAHEPLVKLTLDPLNKGNDSSARVVRGLSWMNSPKGQETKTRYHLLPADVASTVGFRMVREVGP